MGKLGIWLRRGAVAAALAVVAAGTQTAPAASADPPPACGIGQRQVYAITVTGGLVEHTFCPDPDHARAGSRWVGSRVVSTTGWSDASAVFWSGVDRDHGAFYRVSATTGGLYWSADLQSWRQVAAFSLTDWRGYRSFMSPQPGVLYGTDKAGVVHQWIHLGWQTGADTWGPAGVAGAVSKGSRLLGETREGLIGLDAAQPGAVVSNWSESFVQGKLRITVPAAVVPEQIAPFEFASYRTSAFALTRGGRLALLLPVSCQADVRTWYVTDETGEQYRQVFAADSSVRDPLPVEWQCVKQ
jgi:hypothetical protein